MLRHGVTTKLLKPKVVTVWIKRENVSWMLSLHWIDHQIDFINLYGCPCDSTKGQGHVPQEYLNFIVEQMLPKWRKKKLAEFCGYLLSGVFTADESRHSLSKAKRWIQTGGSCWWDRVHWWCWCGGWIGIYQRRTLMVITGWRYSKLAAAKVIGNLLPATTFSLMGRYLWPARRCWCWDGHYPNNGQQPRVLFNSQSPVCHASAVSWCAFQLHQKFSMQWPLMRAYSSWDRAKTIGSFDVGKQVDIIILMHQI